LPKKKKVSLIRDGGTPQQKVHSELAIAIVWSKCAPNTGAEVQSLPSARRNTAERLGNNIAVGDDSATTGARACQFARAGRVLGFLLATLWPWMPPCRQPVHAAAVRCVVSPTPPVKDASLSLCGAALATSPSTEDARVWSPHGVEQWHEQTPSSVRQRTNRRC